MTGARAARRQCFSTGAGRRPAPVLVLLALLSACAPAPVNETPLAPRPTSTPRVGVALVAPPPTLAALTPEPTPLLRDLLLGQHISASGSYSQTETQAAGRMACQIQRDSCAFGLLAALAGHADEGLIFVRADPPYDDEVTLMHADMLRPLARLRELAQAEWGGEVKLLVTAAYDSQGWHDLAQKDTTRKYSLHFEGRSIDLAPFPPTPENMSRLCALAHQAGFDWVHNEDDHCHASVRARSLCDVCSPRAP